MASKTQILSMYKMLLRESENFSNYNFRSYAIRRVRDGFRQNKGLTDAKLLKKEFNYAKENLSILRRQVAIGDMFKTEKLVIENMR